MIYSLQQTGVTAIESSALLGIVSTPDGSQRWAINELSIHEIDSSGSAIASYVFGDAEFKPFNLDRLIGSGCYYNGRLYVPALGSGGPTDYRVVSFYATSGEVSVETSFDISDEGIKPSAVAIDETRQCFWVSCETEWATLWKYDSSGFTFIESKYVPSSVPAIRGLAVPFGRGGAPVDGSIWLGSMASSGLGGIYRFDPDADTVEPILVIEGDDSSGGLSMLLLGDGSEIPFSDKLVWNGVNKIVYYAITVSEPVPEPDPEPDPEPEPDDPRAVSYARQLAQLLPPGRLWNLEPGSFLSRVLLAIAGEFARVDERCGRVIDESDPRTAVETLPDWERVLGIVPRSDASVSERQIACASAYVARGGQTAAYFRDVAARLGFAVEIVVTAPHTWRMDVDLAASSAAFTLRTTEFRAWASRAGDRLESRDVAELETEIRMVKPAHTVVLFAYP